ncbi:AraC family transcriptional regulator of adaptative response/methylated-DNA-[protein]-cysteine methyltransferase [Deinococcus metalli]|uniref:methylated-DNA--[protein]-cysteine S-methyltransferase n=1 Tax=Deinococcus metalli TaxID=1141878 RepID=A0A7W8KFI7_9DEIO|nr:bifunctional DNA-binding transcriptional regulator/O6-methylguanine-DNA methyltransferase Ada [Deinococcus metalli]MBB5376980.1 AraC family transcriptional regulator of adaptative response/methylated-DNA-[protein]-cysteine methyltransferase [Deinococcus metalli]GHF46785.1 O6-methylguanine-DNA methyltransferase [Deinococcus metalli]
MTTESSDDAARWAAVLAHDGAADGTFWYGVSTTGIYCRPGCPSRRPRREHVSFHDSPGAAEAAGFRPCKRCTPERIGAGARAVAHAQALIEAAPTPPALADLAAAVGVSPFHLQRVFKARLGVSPKQYALGRRTQKLKEELKMTPNVTAALYGAGHDSPATLYAPATDQLGMTPGAYARGGAGERIHYAVTDSVLGPMLVAATARGLCAVRFGEPDALGAELRAEYPRAELVEDAALLRTYVEGVQAHLAGRTLPLTTDVPGTDFQRRVWAALREIPRGETRTYAQLAGMIGQPAAVRAVARACATNPVAVVVPCHRIVPKAGGHGGYRWGAERKARLLELERA